MSTPIKNPSKLSSLQQAWLWKLYNKLGFGQRWDMVPLKALERKGLVTIERESDMTEVHLTTAGRAEAARIDAWRMAECDRLTVEEEAGKSAIGGLHG